MQSFIERLPVSIRDYTFSLYVKQERMCVVWVFAVVKGNRALCWRYNSWFKAEIPHILVAMPSQSKYHRLLPNIIANLPMSVRELGTFASMDVEKDLVAACQGDNKYDGIQALLYVRRVVRPLL